MAKRTAVIDIGSNSVRMVIFEKTSRFGFFLLHESKSRVRISEGAYGDGGNLQPAAMARALHALGEFKSIAHAYASRKLLCIATSAVRDAPNRADFLKRVRDTHGINIKVIDGEKEAYLGGVACANLLPAMKAYTIDIGGGSTECAAIERGSVVGNLSINLGTVRLKELFFDKGDIAGAEAFIDAQLAAAALEKMPVVAGIGGTFRALAQIMLKSRRHPVAKLHAFTFGAGDLADLGKKILSAPDNQALSALGVKKERYDIIRPGTLILMRFLKYVGCETVVTSGAGVREGLYLTDLLRHSGHRFPVGFNPSLRYLLDRHTVEPKFSNRLPAVAQRLFDLFQAKYGLPQEQRRLVESALEYGYTHAEIMTVAALVRYHKNKKVAKTFQTHYKTLLPGAKVLNRLNLLLAVADALLAHRPRDIDFELSMEGSVLVVTAKKGADLYLTQEKIAALSLGKEMRIRFANA